MLYEPVLLLTRELAPKDVFWIPVVVSSAEMYPQAVFEYPVEFRYSVEFPTAVFCIPFEIEVGRLLKSAEFPIATLSEDQAVPDPPDWVKSALLPMAVLLLAVVLDQRALFPTAVFL